MSAWRAGISGTKLLEIERGFGVTNLAPSFYFEYLIAESFESLPFSENRTLSRDPLFSQKGDSRGGSPLPGSHSGRHNPRRWQTLNGDRRRFRCHVTTL
jgi:hypothetical protein